MTTTQHTPTPWDFHVADNAEIPHVSIYAVDGGCTIAIMGDKGLDPDCSQFVDEADAAHIVKCVNHHDELVDLLRQASSRLQTYYDRSEDCLDVEGCYVSDFVIDQVEEFLTKLEESK